MTQSVPYNIFAYLTFDPKSRHMKIITVHNFFTLIEIHILYKFEGPTCCHPQVISVWEDFFSISSIDF